MRLGSPRVTPIGEGSFSQAWGRPGSHSWQGFACWPPGTGGGAEAAGSRYRPPGTPLGFIGSYRVETFGP